MLFFRNLFLNRTTPNLDASDGKAFDTLVPDCVDHFHHAVVICVFC